MTEISRPELRGRVLTRTLLSTSEGGHDTTSAVTWIQGDALYCDLRMSADGTVTDGFAGELSGHRSAPHAVQWHRTIDLSPQPVADVGTLTRLDERTITEHGVTSDYLEHWRIDAGPEVDGHELDVDERLVTDDDGETAAVVVRVGDSFGYAHTHPAPEHHLVPALGPHPVVCLGQVTAAGWIVARSSDPPLVGTPLDLSFLLDSADLQEHSP